MHVVHRDLKLDNLLLDGSDNLLLADFGFAEYVGPTNKKLKLLCGSPHYSAPEIFAQQDYYGTQADMWSTGVLLYTILAGHFPFQASSMEALGKKVLKGKPDKPLVASASALDLVQGLLTIKPSLRTTTEQLCTHAWMSAEGALPPVVAGGEKETRWDEAVAAQLEQMGCPVELTKHHISHDSRNHVTAAYEILLLEPPSSPESPG